MSAKSGPMHENIECTCSECKTVHLVTIFSMLYFYRTACEFDVEQAKRRILKRRSWTDPTEIQRRVDRLRQSHSGFRLSYPQVTKSHLPQPLKDIISLAASKSTKEGFVVFFECDCCGHFIEVPTNSWGVSEEVIKRVLDRHLGDFSETYHTIMDPDTRKPKRIPPNYSRVGQFVHDPVAAQRLYDNNDLDLLTGAAIVSASGVLDSDSRSSGLDSISSEVGGSSSDSSFDSGSSFSGSSGSGGAFD